MKILFAANRFPFPPYRGDKLKIYHLAKQLSAKHELHLLTFLQDEKDKAYLDELSSLFTTIHLVPLPKWQSYLNCLIGIFTRRPFQVSYFHSGKMQRKVKALTEKEQFDAVHVQHLRIAQYWDQKDPLYRILDLPDAYSLYWERRKQQESGLARLFAGMEYKRVCRYEQILHRFNRVLVCSEEDKKYLEAKQGLDNIGLLPNGVDTATFYNESADYSHNKTILFTGNMDYDPNVDAVLYFAREIFPSILKALPGTQFIIAGQRPVPKVLELAGDHIRVTGFVQNLADMYRKASIVVSPLRFGAGTQNKVLEAMAMGIPVVSRNVGFSGLDIPSGEGVILANDTGHFTDCCIELLRSGDERARVGRAGKAVIEQRYDWKIIAARLERYLRQENG